MRKYWILSIILIGLLKFPWQAPGTDWLANLSGVGISDGRTNFGYNNQAVTPTALPPTEKPAKTPHLAPTHAPRATAIPPEIPPPTDQRLLRAMILFGVVACLTVVIGLWINRERINPR